MNLVRFLVSAIFSICFYTCIINAFDAYNEGQWSLLVLNVQQKNEYLQQTSPHIKALHPFLILSWN